MPCLEASSGHPRGRNMHLSIAELERLEQMFASGQVRSDPPTLSATDRLMDAMIHAAEQKARVRRARQAMPQPAPQAAPAHATNDPQAADRDGANAAELEAAGEPARDWNTPRTLEELIEIRRALMRNEEPNL